MTCVACYKCQRTCSVYVQLTEKERRVRASVTKLGIRLRELEGTAEQPDIPDHAKQLITKLEGLDSDFKSHHFEVIDLINAEDEEALSREQDICDKQDDDVTSLMVCLRLLASKPSAYPSSHKTLSHKLARLEKCLLTSESALADDTEVLSLVKQHQEQLADYKREIASCYEAQILMIR